MAISVRYFVFEEGGVLRYVPHRIRYGLSADEDAIPAYAGTRQRIAEVVLDNEGGKPIRILDVRGRYWDFDDDGRLNRERWFSFLRFHDPLGEKPRGKVVDLRPDIEKREWRRQNTWDVTAEDLDRITAAIWPWAAEASYPTVEAVKGKARKPPPLTESGRSLMAKIGADLAGIQYDLERLSEPALKGLAYALRRHGRLYEAERGLYEAFADAAERRRAIKARHRTGQGAWYACLDVLAWNADHSVGESVETIEERHGTRGEAVAAARRLLAEHAPRFDLRVTLQAEVFSELEWVPIRQKKEGEPDTRED